jgi:hypothetical protein
MSDLSVKMSMLLHAFDLIFALPSWKYNYSLAWRHHPPSAA